jgi:hypothetical protein
LARLNGLIATIGVSNLLIVQDGDATLVADRARRGNSKAVSRSAEAARLEKYL